MPEIIDASQVSALIERLPDLLQFLGSLHHIPLPSASYILISLLAIRSFADA